MTAPRLAKLRQLCQSGEARRIREASLLERSDLARELGVSETAVRRWEMGERQPRHSDATARYLNLLERLDREAAPRPSGAAS